MPLSHDDLARPIPATTVIIPAAGVGSRMGGDIRKPFLELGGEPILFHTLRRIAALPGVAEVILVVHPADVETATRALEAHMDEWKLGLIVPGGASRAESVWRGVEVMSAESELVAVHDAVRPFVAPEIGELLFRTAAKEGAAVPIIPLADTIKRTEGEYVLETPSRRGLVRIQTPQVFQSDLFIDANEYVQRTGGYSEAITDDASIVEAYGKPVAVVLGSELSFKLTTPRDLKIAEALLQAGMV